MRAEPGFNDDLKLIDPGLFVIWNSLIKRFQILWKDARRPDIGVRIVITVEEDDGSFRPCDRRALLYCAMQVDWESLHKYPDPNDWFRDWMAKRARRKAKSRADRDEYRRWWNKDHKTEWKEAFENARRGVLGLPNERKRKVIVEMPAWAKREGRAIGGENGKDS